MMAYPDELRHLLGAFPPSIVQAAWLFLGLAQDLNVFHAARDLGNSICSDKTA